MNIRKLKSLRKPLTKEEIDKRIKEHLDEYERAKEDVMGLNTINFSARIA